MFWTLFAAALLAPAVYSGRDNQLHVHIPRIVADVTIDGSLNEPVWKEPARLTGFSQFAPQDGMRAPVSTELLLVYSPTALYVGIRAYEAHGPVHAALADRDKIAADDNVQILLGTFQDQRQAYVFGVRRLGVQMDGTIAEQGQNLTGSWTPTLSGRVAPDLSQDFVFTSKGRLTEYSYEVEVRIPFKSLKYQSADVQSWALNVVREGKPSGFEDSWAPAKRSNASFLGQAGTIDSLSGFERGLVLDVNPVVTQKTSGAPQSGRWSYDHERPQVGGSARWGVTNNLTLNGTARPDFAEVESDAGQFVIDPRQALFFPEKRPFFLDGLDQFSTPHNLIYTRRIGQPEGARKLAGKAARTSIGPLSAGDAPRLSPTGADRALYNILRAQRDVGSQSRLGVAYTDRVVGADYNRVADVDGRALFADVYSGSFQAAERFDRAHAAAPLLEGVFARNGKRFGSRYAMTSISDDFRASSGFISRAGIVHAAADHRATWFGAPGAKVETVTGDILFDDTWQYSHFVRHGDAQDKKFHVSSSVGLHGGWALGAAVYWGTFCFDDKLYASYRLLSPAGDTLPFVGVARIPNRDYVASLSTPQWSAFSANLLYIGGQDENFFEWAQANIDYVSLSLKVRPTSRARVEGDLQYQDYWRRTDHSLAGRNVIPRLKLEYQLTRAVFMRLVGAYDLAEHNDLLDA